MSSAVGHRAGGPLTWRAKDTSLDEVLTRLSELMAKCSRSSMGTDSTLRAHTSILNLLVLVPTLAAAKEVETTLEKMGSAHPSRTIILVVKPKAQMLALDAEVGCFADTSARSQFHDQVTLVLHGELALHPDSVVRPLLLSDLPVILWEPFDTEVTRSSSTVLRGLARRHLVDAARSEHWQQRLVQLDALAQGDRPSVVIGDFSWGRTSNWRDAIAGLFDAEYARRHLDHVSQIAIAYESATAAGPVCALLLAGWLMSSLGWTVGGRTVCQEGGQILTFEAGAGRMVTIHPERRKQPPGELLEVRLKATGGASSASFAVVRDGRDPQCAQAICQVGSSWRLAHTLEMMARDNADLLSSELQELAPDHAFASSLAAVGQILRSI